MSVRLRAAVVFACCSLWTLCATAESFAATIERGHQASVEAEFERAVELFDQVMRSPSLSHDERVRVLAERALVLHALGNLEAVDMDLRSLAELEPTHELGTRAPPGLVERWLAIRAAATPVQIAKVELPSEELEALPATHEPKRGLVPLAPAPERHDVPWWRARRGWLIGGSASVVAVSALVLGLVLTRDQSPQRTAVDANLEF